MALAAIPEILDEYRDYIHPAALLLPRPSQSDYDNLKASIETQGVLQPLAIFIDTRGENWVIDGLSRMQVMLELGLPITDEANKWAMQIVTHREAEGADPYEIALNLNLARRHLTPDQKHQVIADLLEVRPDLSDRALARMARVSPTTVGAQRRETAEPTAAAVSEEEAGDDIAGEEQEQEELAPRPRVEESGRRARGRQRGTTIDEPRHKPPPPVEQPFTGTVLPSANKNTRIAEAKRCVKYLGLEVEDLLPRRRTVH